MHIFPQASCLHYGPQVSLYYGSRASCPPTSTKFKNSPNSKSALLSLFLAISLLCFSGQCLSQTIQQKMQQGLTKLDAGDVEAAVTLFREVIAENPQHGPAHLMLGQIALQQGKLQEAKEHLLIAGRSNLQRPHLAWQLLGKVDLMLQSYQSALRNLKQSLELTRPESPDLMETKLLILALQDDPQSENELRIAIGENLAKSEPYLALGIRFLRTGRTEDALPILEIASQIDDRDPLARFLLQNSNQENSRKGISIPRTQLTEQISRANSYVHEKRLDEAAEIAKSILKERPKMIPAHLILIEVAEGQGERWEALAQYREILDWLPNIPAIDSRFAILARDMQAYDLAECSIAKALKVRPNDGSFHYLLATILSKQGKTDLAIDSCKQAIALGFETAEVFITLGNLYYGKMAISESIQALGKAVELNPRAAENIASFALSALTTNQYKALQELLEKFVEANPENANTLYSLGVMNLNNGQLTKAKECFLRLEKLKPQFTQVHYNLALIYSREGDENKAKAAIDRFQKLKTEEQKDWLKHNQGHQIRQQAVEALQKGDRNRAVLLYSQLVESGTAEKDDLLATARAEQSLKNYPGAYSWYEKALKVAPYDREIIEGLAVCTAAMNRTELEELYRARLKLLSLPC